MVDATDTPHAMEPLIASAGYIEAIDPVRVYDTAKDAAWWRETYARGVGSYEGR